jgi:Skp family chaperone for outer membrane proteins
MSFLRITVFALTVLAGGTTGFAQTNTGEAPDFGTTGFLVIDQDLLFTRSAFGQRAIAQAEAATEELVQENTEIEDSLIAEEQALTDQRPNLSAEDFRRLADDFDEKVQRIRAEQSGKNDEIAEIINVARRDFFQAVIPVLAELMRENRALAILDKRTVLLSANLIDVTDRAITRIDERLGDGTQASDGN